MCVLCGDWHIKVHPKPMIAQYAFNIISDIVVSTVHADVPAGLIARLSAGTEVAMLGL